MKRKIFLIILGLVLGAAETALGWSILPQNFLGALLMFTGLGYCLGGCLFLAFSPRATIPGADRSLLALVPGALLILLMVPIEYLFLPETLPRERWMQWTGLGILLLGLLLRIWIRHILKGAYQGNLQVHSGQRLITSGPYRWIRHPGYLGFVLEALGLAVGFSSLSGLLGILALIAGLRYRMKLEEQMLLQSFAKEYVDYAGRTRRMIPGIW